MHPRKKEPLIGKEEGKPPVLVLLILVEHSVTHEDDLGDDLSTELVHVMLCRRLS